MKRILCILIIALTFKTLACLKRGDLAEYENLPYQNSIIYYSDFGKLVDRIQMGTSYIYFGKPDCPWCQQYLPIYNDSAEKNNQKILYYNTEKDKYTYEVLDENNNLMIKVSEKYIKVVNWIYQFDPNLDKGYVSINNNLKDSLGNYHSSVWLFVPRLFKVKDGKIIDFIGTAEGHVMRKNEKGEMYLPDLNDVEKMQFRVKINKMFD